MFNFKLKPTQTQIFAFFLLVYSILATTLSAEFSTLFLLLYCWIFSYSIFYILKFLTKKPKQYLNTFISITIFFLVYHYTNNSTGLIPYTIGLIAILSYKYFAYYKGSPIINPATFGLITAELSNRILINLFHVEELSSPFISWWGAQFGGYTSLILIIGWMLYGVKKWNRQWVIIPFLVIFILYLIVTFNLQFTLSFLLSSTVYFYAAIMLIEPRTSPALKKQQIIYGSIAGILYFLFVYLNIGFHEIYALLVANFYNFHLRLNALKKTKKTIDLPQTNI